MGADFVTGGFYQSAPCQECAALRRELTSYRELPLVPAAEHRRVLEQRDLAQSQADALAGELAAARDSRTHALANERLAIMQRCARYLGSATFGHGGEREAFLALFAHVAEHGRHAEVDAHRAAYEAWEARRR